MSPNKKPLAGTSFDLDNVWSYQKIHGDSCWKDLSSCLDILIPEVLELLDRVNLKITFFIIGQDVVLEKNHKMISQITENGHSVGNHSFRHDSWLHHFSSEEIQKEISETELAIEDATGHKPIGFRGPGYSISRDVISVLKKLGYLYDASLLPTWIGPLARFYYFRKSDLTEDEKSKRGRLFGGFRESLYPIKPFYWEMPREGDLLEIPVTTIPCLKIPFHFSYLLYLSRFNVTMMYALLRTVMKLCRAFNTGLSFLLHPVDFLSQDEIPELSFFPGMDIKKKEKRRIFLEVMRLIQEEFRVVSMDSYAEALINGDNRLPKRSLEI